MIVNTVCNVTHTTIADQTAWYSVPFTYVTVLNIPQITVTLDGTVLTYGADYTLGVSGVQLTEDPGAGKMLVIARSTPMTQTIDFQTGFIDPDELERALDLAAMRDQELASRIQNFSASIDSTVTLLANGWTSNVQTLTVNGVTQLNTVLVGPEPTSVDNYVDAGILCIAQGNNSLTFSCDTVPSVDITVNVAVLK